MRTFILLQDSNKLEAQRVVFGFSSSIGDAFLVLIVDYPYTSMEDIFTAKWRSYPPDKSIVRVLP